MFQLSSMSFSSFKTFTNCQRLLLIETRQDQFFYIMHHNRAYYTKPMIQCNFISRKRLPRKSNVTNESQNSLNTIYFFKIKRFTLVNSNAIYFILLLNILIPPVNKFFAKDYFLVIKLARETHFM